MRLDGWIVVIVTAFGCSEPKDDSPDTSATDTAATGTDTDTAATDSDTDTATDHGGTTPPAGVCANGEWGPLTAEEALDAVHVAPDGSDDAAGTWDAPFATLDAALAAAPGGTIFLHPGVYAATEVLSNDHDGLRLVGCSASEVTIEAADPEEPVLLVGGTLGLRLEGITLSGGTRGLQVWLGADAVLDDVAVTGSARTGIVFEGSDTIVAARGIAVSDVVPDDGGSIGYGVLIVGASVMLEESSVTGATTVGIFSSQADLSLSDVTVEDTAPDAAGHAGRGLLAQNDGTLAITGSRFTGSADAGVMVLGLSVVTMEGVTVEDTRAGTLSSDPSITTGDGIVVAQALDTNYDPAGFSVSIVDSVVTGSARAGVVVADVTATLSGNTADASNAYSSGGTSIFAQGDADVSASTDTVVFLSDPLEFDPIALDLDGAAP